MQKDLAGLKGADVAKILFTQVIPHNDQLI